MFLCVYICVPFCSSELLGTLSVDSHGPVHAAGEALLQQEFCYVAVLTQRGKQKRAINKTESLNVKGTSTTGATSCVFTG